MPNQLFGLGGLVRNEEEGGKKMVFFGRLFPLSLQVSPEMRKFLFVGYSFGSLFVEGFWACDLWRLGNFIRKRKERNIVSFQIAYYIWIERFCEKWRETYKNAVFWLAPSHLARMRFGEKGLTFLITLFSLSKVFLYRVCNCALVFLVSLSEKWIC